MSNTISTITLEKTTKSRLAKYGGLEESYDDVVNKILDFYDSNYYSGNKKK